MAKKKGGAKPAAAAAGPTAAELEGDKNTPP
jgi:hypothetical protein